MEKSIKKVFVEKKVIEIDCDLGTQDIAWLAMSAAYSYGLSNYPVSRYIPCSATNKTGEILHPKLCLLKYEKLIGEEIYIKIRPDSQDVNSDSLNRDELLWLDQAFGNERFYMNITLK
jgi:hypothetical protein